jgi:hypothetical protein
MRGRFTVLGAAGLAWLLAVGLQAQAQAPIAPPAEYQQAMKEIASAVQTLNAFGKTQDFEAAGKAATAARTAFQSVEQFWTGRKDTEAARLATTAARAAGDAVAAAGLKSAEGVEFAVKEMTGTCATCHMAHRERKDDGTFVIK